MPRKEKKTLPPLETRRRIQIVLGGIDMNRGRKFAGLVLSAMLFGTVAGGTMVGVNALSDQYRSEVLGQASDNIGSSLLGENEANKEAQSNSVQQLNSSSKNNSSEAGGSVSEIAKNAMPEVVSITNTIRYQQYGYSIFGQSGEQEAAASGSGVIIGKNDSELLIVTNNHVVEDSTALSVQFVDGKSYDAEIKGTDSDVDLAVIAIPLSSISQDTLNSISFAKYGDSDSISVGDQVVAIGNALGYGQSVTTGIISAKDRDISTKGGTESGLLQTDAAINPGNSGGALLNMNGELIGINVAKYSDTTVEGMGYSIPSKKVKEIVEGLSKRTTRAKVSQEEKGYIGIQGKTVDSSISEAYNMPEGIYIFKLLTGEGIDNSALQEKDIITKFDGQSVASLEELSGLLSRYKAGEKVEVTVQRLSGKGEYEEKTVSVTLGKNSETVERG